MLLLPCPLSALGERNTHLVRDELDIVVRVDVVSLGVERLHVEPKARGLNPTDAVLVPTGRIGVDGTKTPRKEERRTEVWAKRRAETIRHRG